MLHPVTAGAIGLAAGVLIAGAVASWGLRRHVRKVRAAERRARSAERMAELGSMTGGLAHEIKNPLSTIGLNAQLLGESIEELEIDSDVKGRLGRRIASLRREAERLRGILTDFLEFAGEVRLDARGADLNALVEELVDFFTPQAEKHGVRLRVDLAPGTLAAPMDTRAVKQAVLNLMLNAVQAISARGASAAEAVSVPRELILKTASSADTENRPIVVLHVIDTGPGIPPDARERVFRPYFTTKSGGTGLGLPTARRMIEAHGGHLDFHTEVGRGTDFVITLPSGAGDAQRAAAEPSGVTAPTSPAR